MRAVLCCYSAAPIETGFFAPRTAAHTAPGRRIIKRPAPVQAPDDSKEQETWTYGYDQRNQLISVEKRATDGGALQLKDEFRYDAFGNRIEKKIDSNGDGSWDTTQRYALDGWKNVNQALVGNENWDVWADLDGSSSLTTRYIRGDVIDQLFARITSAGAAYWHLTDHLGSIRDVIDSSAVVKDSITYDGFGNITAETDSNFRGRYAWTGGRGVRSRPR